MEMNEQGAMLPRLQQSENIFETQRRFFIMINRHLLPAASADLSAVDDATLVDLPGLTTIEQKRRLQDPDAVQDSKAPPTQEASETKPPQAAEGVALPQPAAAEDTVSSSKAASKSADAAGTPETPQELASSKEKATESTAKKTPAKQKEASKTKPAKAADSVALPQPAAAEDKASSSKAASKNADAARTPETLQELASSKEKATESTAKKAPAKQKEVSKTKPAKAADSVALPQPAAAEDKASSSKAASKNADAARTPETLQELASSKEKATESTAKKAPAKQKEVSKTKPAKAADSVDKASSSKTAPAAEAPKPAKNADASGAPQEPASSPEKTVATPPKATSAKSTKKEELAASNEKRRDVEVESTGAESAEQTQGDPVYTRSFEADVRNILAGKVNLETEQEEAPSPAKPSKKKQTAAKKVQETEEHLESLLERKVKLIAVALVGDLHRNGRIETVMVCEAAQGRSSVVVSKDLLKGSRVRQALKQLLEAKEVVKVMHDCRMAADALGSLLDIQLCSVFDTAIAWQMLQETDPSSSTESTIFPVLQKFAPLAAREVKAVQDRKKKAKKAVQLNKEQAIFSLLGLKDEQPSLDKDQLEAIRFLELKGLLTASLAMGHMLEGQSRTFNQLCQKGLSEFRAWPGQHVMTLPRGRRVPFSFEKHRLVCHLNGSEKELKQMIQQVQEEKVREATEAAAEIEPLLRILPEPILEVVQRHIKEVDSNPMEIVISVGRPLEFRWKEMGERQMRSDFLGEPATKENVELVVQRIGKKNFTIQDRAGIDGTLHRISAARNQSGEVVTLIMRVGRASSILAGLLEDILLDSKSILMLGPPGVGKTTLLRACAATMSKTRPTVIVDPAGEIAGCGDQPHKAVGRALKDMAYSRSMRTRSEARREAMTRVLENMTPKVLVVDEIGTKGEAQAARTIGERGVQLVATAHGHNLSDLLSNTDLRDLAGGIATSTVGDANERYKASGRKTVSERSCRPVFSALIEIRSPLSVAIHTDLARSVDVALMGRSLTVQVRSRDEEGQMWVEWQRM
ncbi:ycf45 [Symbiodinium natans]|uniref:Ycf45 protein n=1 Tax=Symbiodinium natans TaxID=878477 RepID=A0A812SDI3_9DINO|nr:ycf45 [Symbiodinium natans]